MDKRDVERIGVLLEILKRDPQLRQIMLDEGQDNLDALFQSSGKGEEPMEFIAYYRVSTKRQGASGLGLDAQESAVGAFCASNGGRVVKSYTEVESGRKTAEERPELAAALADAKRRGAVLVVAKLDRLARNVAFLSRLMEAGVDFRAVDNAHANRLTLHILASVAEWEREAISQRTKEGLAQAKKRGVKLGSARPGHWEGREEARRQGGLKGLKKAHEVVSRKAREEYADLAPRIAEMRDKGLSFRKIADALNSEGHRTRRGKMFHPSTVRNILGRVKEG